MLIRVTHLFYNVIFSSGKLSAASAAVFNSLLRTLQFFCCSNKYSKRFAFLRAFLVGFFKSRFSSKFFPEKLHQFNEKKFDDDDVLFI